MEITLFFIYIWAGATTGFALWLFADLHEALEQAYPETFTSSGRSSTSVGPAVFLVVVIVWPLMLFVWLWREWQDRR